MLKLHRLVDSHINRIKLLEQQNQKLSVMLLNHSDRIKNFGDHLPKLMNKEISKLDECIVKVSHVLQKIKTWEKTNQVVREKLNEKVLQVEEKMLGLETRTQNYDTIENDLQSLISIKEVYAKENERLKSKISEDAKTIENLMGVTDQTSASKIHDYELQLKSYKALNEEYKANIKKLEDIISERKIMAPFINSKTEPIKRPLSPSAKENYHGIFSKKSRQQ
ncbi:hypothetical protein RF11_05885 [Thelohanellus kitauei]|uniref:Uncharacterized protein n=1 Tax=Thelohanellus kitauei TaxID=669202 RepID=A0A0C2MG99_THEKT|nr:hypothetical protein RF11_05885 [Thelohanellus kitauei]